MLRPPLPAAASTRGVFTRAEAVAAGWTPRAIRTALAGQTWRELGRGVYADARRLDAADAAEHHRLLAVAAALRRRVVVTGPSAAVVHRLPLIDPPPAAAQVRRADDVDPGDVVCVDGVAVLSPVRTVVDVARECGTDAGIVVADAAIGRGLVTRPALEVTAAQLRGWPGAGRAAVVAREANGLAESPLESLSRLRLLELGLPRPELQVTVPTRSGVHYRVDFLWRRERLVGEADGLGKYADAAALRAEKRRQVALEDAGYAVVRWLWAEIRWEPEVVGARVLRSLTR